MLQFSILCVVICTGAKKYNNQHWWAKMTLGENYWTTNQSIICTPSNEKQKKIKDITKSK